MTNPTSPPPESAATKEQQNVWQAWSDEFEMMRLSVRSEYATLSPTKAYAAEEAGGHDGVFRVAVLRLTEEGGVSEQMIEQVARYSAARELNSNWDNLHEIDQRAYRADAAEMLNALLSSQVVSRDNG